MTSRLDEIVSATPATRNRWVDFLRAASIVAVVLGHWMIGIIAWDGGIIRTTSAIGVTPLLWLATWFLQVMPIFFFVGGFSNLVAYDATRRRGASSWTFIRGRIDRLLRPSLVFLGVWAVVMVILHLSNTGTQAGPPIWGDTRLLRGVLPPGATVPFGPLWFLAVYLVVVSVSPWTVALHRRFGMWVSLTMALGAAAVDVIAFGFGHPALRWANVAFILLFPHQMGHAYADGTLERWPRRAFWAMVVGGLFALFVLTNPDVFRWIGGDARFTWFPGIGHYPKSLLGTDVELVSNAYPPTVPFLLGGIWSIGAVMLLRERGRAWLEHPRPWKVTIYLNSIIMTLFLWHMTAYLIAILLLWPLGFGHETDSTVRWWLERSVWVLVPGAILAGLVAIFGRFERPRRSGSPEARGATGPAAPPAPAAGAR
ncbi:MAG TPA: acyltransferase [Actinomycetota bacterium]|jgi:fucose 4-O-acetylase-like acetyltransferase